MRRSFLTKAIVAVGVMASAMVLSSVAVLAATSISKTLADGSIDLSEIPTSATSNTEYTFGDENNNITMTIAYDSGYKVIGGSKTLLTINTNGAETITLTGTSTSGTRTLTLKSGTTSNISTDPSTGFTTSGTTVNINVSVAGTYTYQLSGNIKITNLKLEKASTVPTSDTYTWSIAENSNFDLSENNFTFTKTTTGKTNTFALNNGTGYKAKNFPTEITIPEEGTLEYLSVGTGTLIEGSAEFYNYPVTVTLQDDWFEEEETIPILTNITLTSSLSSADLTSGDISQTKTVKNFVLTPATSGNAFKVDSGSSVANGNNYSQRINTNGTSTANGARTISFTTSEPNTTLYVWALSTNNSTNRIVNIWDESGDVVGTIDAYGKDNIPNFTAVPGGSVVLTSVGTYSIGSANSNIGFYLVGTDKAIASNSTKISDKLKASTITNNIDVGETGIVVTPMYATDGTNGYLVLQFTDNEALQNATSLTYAGDTYTSLYSSVVFDADTNDKLEDGLFLGFIVENDPTAYETIGGSITIE